MNGPGVGHPPRVAIVTDAWEPQTNGVVRTLQITVERLGRAGHPVLVIEPGLFRTLPCPSYPEIRLALLPGRALSRHLDAFKPDAVHIATEGPLGAAARRWCMSRRMPFTTSYHTQFPEYVRSRLPVPLDLSYAWLRRFHAAAARTFVATPTLQSLLESRGFRNLVRWSRGVDTELFRPRTKTRLDLPRPVSLYCGRVAVEKNIGDFLSLDIPGTKVVVGDGPARAALASRHPEVVFTGYQYGSALAELVAAADVFVFPSRTDTFGLVLLEAMASGVPVAAYPVTGPIDVVANGVSGVLDDNLADAVRGALTLDPVACRNHALRFTWDAATRQFLGNLAVRGFPQQVA